MSDEGSRQDQAFPGSPNSRRMSNRLLSIPIRFHFLRFSTFAAASYSDPRTIRTVQSDSAPPVWCTGIGEENRLLLYEEEKSLAARESAQITDIRQS